jgi:hypothetical protein
MKNTLSFDLVKKGRDSLRKLGICEEEFEIVNVHVKLTTLNGEQLRLTNQYVTEYMKSYDQEASDESFALDSTLDFFMVRKIETLAHSIVHMGDLNLEGHDYIETSRPTQDSPGTKIQKHVFMRQILLESDQNIVDLLYRKYADLVERAEDEALQGLVFRNPEDELAKLEEQAAKLRKQLGHDPEEESARVEGEGEGEVELDLTEDNLRERLFAPVESDEQAQEILRDRRVTAPAARTQPKPEASETPEVRAEAKQEGFVAGGVQFSRLDDPDAEIGEEEQAFLQEQEALYQERYGESPARQPLNQVNPQVHTSPLPSQTSPRVVRQSNFAQDDEFEVAEGIHGASQLHPKK